MCFVGFVKKGAAKIVLGHRDVGKLNGYLQCPGTISMIIA